MTAKIWHQVGHWDRKRKQRVQRLGINDTLLLRGSTTNLKNQKNSYCENDEPKLLKPVNFTESFVFIFLCLDNLHD